MSTFDVRIQSIEEYKGKNPKTGKPRSTYRVRWVVAKKRRGESFQTKAPAESFQAKLITA